MSEEGVPRSRALMKRDPTLKKVRLRLRPPGRPSRRVLEIARTLEALERSELTQRMTAAVAELPELSVANISRLYRAQLEHFALQVGFINLDSQQQMMLMSILLGRDDDDDEYEDAAPGRPRTPATVE